MGRKLGELLLAQGLISRGTLEEALRQQLVYGSRIGTVLVQMDQLRLEDLGRTLSLQNGVPLAEASWLEQIPRQILEQVPPALCQKLRLVPFRWEGDALLLAMCDPQRHVAGQVSYALGRPVLRYVVPELRLMYCLERYYGIPREPRFLRSPGQSPSAHEERRRYIQTVAPPDPAPSQLAPDKWAEENDLISLDEYQAPEEELARPDPIVEAVEEIDLSDLDEPEIPVHTPRRVDLVLQELDSADSGSAVAELLVQPLWEPLSLSVLFWVRDKVAVAYQAGGLDEQPANLRQLAVPLTNNSMLRFAYEMRSTVSGEAVSDPVQAKIAAHLGAETPGQSCVASITVKGRAICLLCLQTPCGSRFEEGMLDELRKLIERASSAYRRLLSRRL